MAHMTLREQLKRDEGVVLTPYRDSVGKLTIGVGRNLDDVGISQAEADFLLDNDIDRTRFSILDRAPWANSLSECRQAVVVNMVFNLGIGGFLKFKNTIAALKRGAWETAARGMLDSKWATQVGPRAHRLAKQMRTDTWQ